MRGISRLVADLVASQEGLCSMELEANNYTFVQTYLTNDEKFYMTVVLNV